MDSYLKDGHQILIDDDTLWKFPMAEYRTMYDYFLSRATNVAVEAIHEFELNGLYEKYPQIQELTLRNMNIIYDCIRHRTLPSLRTLIIIDSNVSNGALESYVIAAKSLRVLYLQGGTDTYFMKFPWRLESLTVKNQKITMGNQRHRSLTSLTIDYFWNCINNENILHFQNLDHFKVTRSVDWKDMAAIKELNLKSVSIQHICQIPEQENLILKLNDDCLLHLRTFLSQNDWLSLLKTHFRFHVLPIAHYRLEMGDYMELPFLKSIGPQIQKMNICYYKKKFHGMLSFFPNLTELDTSYECLLDYLATHPQIFFKTLHLWDGSSDMDDIFRKLNPTLEKLHISVEKDTVGLTTLTNIREFTLGYSCLTREVILFLGINRETLQKMSLYVKESPYFIDLWRAISQLSNLRILILTFNGFFPIPDIPNGSLPMLEELVLERHRAGFCKFITQLDGSRLRSFKSDGDHFEGSDVWIKAQNLEELDLSDIRDKQNLIHSMLILKKLKKLKVGSIGKSDYMLLIQAMTSLANFQTSYIPRETIPVIRDYLKRNNRKLCINGTQMG